MRHTHKLNRMRIALYYNLPSGGAKRTLKESAKRLSTRHHIDVYTLKCANHDFSDLRPYVDSYNVFNFKPLPLLSFPMGRLNQVIRLLDLQRLRVVSRLIASEIKQGNYDVILVHPCMFETSPSILRLLPGFPTVYYCHEPLRGLYETIPGRPYDGENSHRRRILNRWDPLPHLYRSVVKQNDLHNIRSACMVLVNSKFIRDAVRRIYKIDALVSYHGIDTQIFKPLPVEKRQMLLSVGSLTPLKGFDLLIQAVSKIPSDKRPTLTIACNFQNLLERNYLEDLAKESNVNLELLLNISDERLVRLYNQAKITVYVPIREPFGLVPLESMACGTPVIGVREGGILETVVDGYNGQLVERNPTNLADAIQHLLSSPTIVTSYGQNGREHVLHNWTWDQATTTLENYLIKCAEKKYEC